ncbi:hypothetical protein Tco_0100426, partial [Tanacetum coccineum]
SIKFNNTILIIQTRFNFPRVDFYFILQITTSWSLNPSFFVLPEGCDPLVLVDYLTPVEDNIGLLEVRSDVESMFGFVFAKDVTGSMNLTFLSLFIGVTTTNCSPELLILGQVLLMCLSNS